MIQGNTSVAEPSRQFYLTRSAIKRRLQDGKRGMVNELNAWSKDVREQYERHLKDLQEGYREAMLDLHAPKSWRRCWGRVRAVSLAPTGAADEGMDGGARSARYAAGSGCRGVRCTTARPSRCQRCALSCPSRSKR